MSKRRRINTPRHDPNLHGIRTNFDRKALARICRLPEQDFAHIYGMETIKVPQVGHDFYHFKDNGSNILAVAHLDTVADPSERQCRFVDTAAGPVVFSRALDDRLGAYVILDLLPRLGMKFDILLTTGEEFGRSTATFFEERKQYNWVIEFDRGGTDVVMYQYEDAETRAMVKATGARVEEGIFSDISVMDHLGVKCFNWGVGYMDYHGPRAHAYLADTFKMVSYFQDFHREHADTFMPHYDRPMAFDRFEDDDDEHAAMIADWYARWEREDDNLIMPADEFDKARAGGPQTYKQWWEDVPATLPTQIVR